MLNDLNMSLRNLLTPAFASYTPAVHITFQTPDGGGQRAGQPTHVPSVNLFLYDIRENRERRDNNWDIERQGGVVTRRPMPVKVDCSYLVTAWGSESNDQNNSDELKLLSTAMNVLLGHGVIPDQYLVGTMNKLRPSRVIALQPSKLQSIGEFWQAVGGKPKASLDYTVTINVQPFEPVIAGPPVTESLIALGHKDQLEKLTPEQVRDLARAEPTES